MYKFQLKNVVVTHMISSIFFFDTFEIYDANENHQILYQLLYIKSDYLKEQSPASINP